MDFVGPETVFVGDLIAAFTYAQSHGASTAEWANPIRRLMRAVLHDAIHRYVRREVESMEWIADDGIDPFGFVFVCDELGIDARRLRAELPLWRDRMSKGASKAVPRRSPATGNRIDGSKRPRRAA
jgi:hypothetical protein